MAWWRLAATAKSYPSAPLRLFSSTSSPHPKNFTPNPNLPPSLALSLASLNSRRRKKLKKKLSSPRLKPIQPVPFINPAFESILSLDARFRFLTRARLHLARFPGHSLPLSLAGKLHRELGFPRGRKVSTLALRHPLLFSVGPATAPRIALTPLMDSLLDEERAIMDSMESHRITTVRKLLMMSRKRRIPLSKLHHCRLLFGLPDDFRDRVRNYPEFFRVAVDPDARHVLELAQWDPKLAVSALEKEFITDEQRIRRTFSFPILHSRSLGLDEEDERKMRALSTFPLVSPYSDGWKFELWTVEAEKYRVGLLHEFLSLTLEKRASIHHIVEFKEEFSLTRRMYQMLAKQPRAFYLAGTEMNWVVFLKDAYREDGTLIEKEPQSLFEEKLRRYACMTEKDLEKETVEGEMRV